MAKKTSLLTEINKEVLQNCHILKCFSSIEREIIGSWVENGFSEELILAALKETVFNGVSNLRYMDKILHEWNESELHHRWKHSLTLLN